MQASTRLIEITRNLRILFELNSRPGDSVLVITDSLQHADVWMGIATAGRTFGCEVTVSLMADPRESHRTPPPKPVIEAMKVADLTISATSKELHTNGCFHYATDGGHKFLIMEEVTPEILLGPAVKADYRLMNEVGPKLKEVMDRGGRWHVTSESGTDYTCEARSHTGRWMAAQADRLNNEWGAALAAFPDGEFGADPTRGSGQGRVVWDTSVQHPSGLLREPIILTIHDGLVTRIEGGAEARELSDYIRKYGDGPNNEFDMELSIGFNPMCPLTGVLRTDKKHYGKIHTAIGDLHKGQLHIDGVTRRPTISIGGETIVDEGSIKIPPLDTWI
jgi:leucyl aminopeptidase (aminopeptidase T)